MEAAPTNASLGRLPVWLLVLALAGYGVLLWHYAGPQPGGSDSSGYFNTARLLAQGSAQAPLRTVEGLPGSELPAQAYTPLGFHTDSGRKNLVPTYPIGLPLLLLAGLAAGGTLSGGKLVFVAHALAGVWLMHRLVGELGGGRLAALAGALLLAFSPLYLMQSLYCMSDLPSLVWVCAALAAGLASRRHPSLAVASGAAFGLAILLRPANAVILPALACTLGTSPRRWWRLVAGGLPFAAILLAFNHAAYGSVFASGYDGLSDLFGWKWVWPSLRNYLQCLPGIASPLVLLVAGLPWLYSTRRPVVAFLACWAGAYLVFYAAYFHTHEHWWYLRFILPALPALLIAALLVLEHLAAGRQGRLVWSAAALVAAAGLTVSIQRWHPFSIGREEDIYRDATRWVQSQVPAESVVFSMQLSGALYYYTDYRLLRWDTLEDKWPAVRTALIRSRRPVYGAFFDFEAGPATEQRLPGRWTKLGQLHQVSLWRLDLPAAP